MSAVDVLASPDVAVRLRFAEPVEDGEDMLFKAGKHPQDLMFRSKLADVMITDRRRLSAQGRTEDPVSHTCLPSFRESDVLIDTGN
jgi:hypothetical protein